MKKVIVKDKNDYYVIPEAKTDIDIILKLANRAIDDYGRNNIDICINEENNTFEIYYSTLHDSFPIYITNIKIEDIDMDKLREETYKQNIGLCE